MNEWFSQNYENWDNKKWGVNKNSSSFNNLEIQVQQNYFKYKTFEWAGNLSFRQITENNTLKDKLEKPIIQDTRESLDKEAMINEARTILYEKLGIDNNQNNNSALVNFEKWIIDTLILDNYDLAIQVWETNWKILIDSLKQLASLEWLKKVAEAIWENIWNLLSWNAYERWKSVAELWLITTWVWAWVYVWKKWFKLWMKQISRLRKTAERVVENPEIKDVIWTTRWKVDEIVPKKELDLDDNLKRSIDIERQIKWLEKLWIPESLSKDMLESWLIRKEFFGWDLLRRFEDLHKKWIDYNKMIDEVIKQIPNLTREEALIIFSYTDEVIYRRLNAFLRWKKEVVDSLTPHNIEVSKRLALKLEQALEKMPNLKSWEDWFILRWDKWKYWDWKIWDEIELTAFSSVSNNKKDIFLWEKHDTNTQVSIIWKEWRVKDISKLSIAVNFWVSKEELEILTNFSGKLKKLPKTNNEWVILPNSIVKILDRFKLDNINYIDVEQTK